MKKKKRRLHSVLQSAFFLFSCANIKQGSFQNETRAYHINGGVCSYSSPMVGQLNPNTNILYYIGGFAVTTIDFLGNPCFRKLKPLKILKLFLVSEEV